MAGTIPVDIDTNSSDLDIICESSDLGEYESILKIHYGSLTNFKSHAMNVRGAPFTGLKIAGQDLGPAIPMADKELEDGDIEPLVKLLTTAIQSGVKSYFNEARSNKKFASSNVKAGREFVENMFRTSTMSKVCMNPQGSRLMDIIQMPHLTMRTKISYTSKFVSKNYIQFGNSTKREK